MGELYELVWRDRQDVRVKRGLNSVYNSHLARGKGRQDKAICIFMKEPGGCQCSPTGGGVGSGGLESGREPLHKEVHTLLLFNYVTESPIQKYKK